MVVQGAGVLGWWFWSVRGAGGLWCRVLLLVVLGAVVLRAGVLMVLSAGMLVILGAGCWGVGGAG